MKNEVEPPHQSGGWIAAKESLFEFLSNKKVLAALTIIPAILLFTFVNVVPILWAISASFFDLGAFTPEWTWVGLANYHEILGRSAFWDSLGRSVVFAGGSIALQLTAGLALALLLDRSFKFNNLATSLAIVPYMIPTAVVGFLFAWMANSNSGIVNQILLDLGLIDSYASWFGNPDLAMFSVIVAGSWKFSVFVMIMVLSRLQSIPEEFYEAARMCGASYYQVFRDIILPNIKGVIFIVLLLRGIWMFNKFDVIYILTGGGPFSATTTAPIYAYQVSFQQNHLDLGATISVILFLLLAAGAAVYFRVLEPSQEVRVE